MLQRIRTVLPRPGRLFLLLVALDVVLFSLLRLAFHVAFAPPGDAPPAAVIAEAFRVGMKFDVRLAVILALPLLLPGGLRPLSPFAGPRRRRFWIVFLTLTHLAVLFAYAVDFGHYSYTGSRLNATVLQFLSDPGTSARMVWESYPLVRGAIGLALAGVGLLALFSRLITRTLASPPACASRRSRLLASVLLGLLAAGGLYGKFSWYPLRWSDAYFSTDPYAGNLAHNPLLLLAETLRTDAAAYDLAKVRAAYPLVARYLGVERPDRKRLVYTRRRPPQSEPARRPNLVIVLLESFAAYKTGAFGNPLDPTPHFDALARDGLLFTRFYTPTWGTARSVFATVTGLPDVETRQTATRNPRLVSQHTVLNDFPGYARLYFLGGSLNWANIRGLLARNVEGLQIFEEGSYRASRIDVWGISDLDLFREAVPVLSRQKEPFVAFVQTSGSHRPYTIPEDNAGFVPRDIPDAEAARNGFISAAEYNAFRFLDHGIGRFMDLAAREPWYANTVFAFYGDHGLPGDAPHLPRADVEMGLTHFHVPFLLYAPDFFGPPAIVETVASELDVLPTLASLAGVTCFNGTFGRDLFDPEFDDQRYAFTIGDQGKLPALGLIGPTRAFAMFGDGSHRRLAALDGGDPRENLLAKEPRAAARMERLCRALYETAKYLPYVNTPENVKAPLPE